MQRHPQTGLVPAGAPLGGGACGSSLRSSSSAPLLCMLLTARLTGQSRAVQRSWTACTESTLQHMGGEMPKLMAQGIPEPANV